LGLPTFKQTTVLGLALVTRSKSSAVLPGSCMEGWSRPSHSCQESVPTQTTATSEARAASSALSRSSSSLAQVQSLQPRWHCAGKEGESFTETQLISKSYFLPASKSATVLTSGASLLIGMMGSGLPSLGASSSSAPSR